MFIQPSLQVGPAGECESCIGQFEEPIRAECPFDVSGLTLPGFPGVLAGHNGTIAWATAALGADVSDFFYEQVTGDSAVRDGALVPLQLSAETIKVRGGSDIPMTVRRTTRGPILSDAMPSVDEAGRRAVVNGVAERQRYAVSLAWTGFTPSRTADAIFGISTAGSFAEFRAAATGYAVPALSLVYADVVPVEGTSVADIDEKAFDAYFSRRYGQLPDLLLPQTLQNKCAAAPVPKR